MVEITVAIFVISIGMMGVASSFDSFRKLIGSSSKRNVAAHVAQQEVERLAAVGYKDLVLAAAPATTGRPEGPALGCGAGPRRGTGPARTPRSRIS